MRKVSLASLIDTIADGEPVDFLARAINSDWRICFFPYPHIRTAPKGRAAYPDRAENSDGETVMANDYVRDELIPLIENAPRLARASRRLMLALDALAKHPANDATKRFDEKLYEQEYAEAELRKVLIETLGEDALDTELVEEEMEA